MTSLLVDQRARPTGPGGQRPLALIATLGGLLAALGPLLVFAAIGIIGWFAADAGAHGEPRDGMRMGALAWLMAHGSGITVDGVAVGIVPLGLTAVCGWTMWRVGHRVGEALSGHGPDADRIADGERDLTVPTAAVLFFTGYAVAAVVTATLAASPQTSPSVPRVVMWSLVMALVLGMPAIAVGSGRAAIWASLVPAVVRQGAATGAVILTAFAAVSAMALLLALGFGVGQAATMMSQLHLTVGEGAAYAVGNAVFVPNASLFSGSFLLGPGFAVGGNTLVSAEAVVLGPLPLFALLAAVPDVGAPAPWVGFLVALPSMVAAAATAWWQRRRPVLNWVEGALRGCGGGIGAGVVFAVLASISGGAAGPGRMRHVGPFVPDVLVAAITAFGLGGLVGALLMTWWQRRGSALGHHLDSRPVTTRLVVLVSGAGTNLQALIDACADPAYGAQVVAVGADRDGIEGLARADRAGIATFVKRVSDFTSREHWDRALADSVAGFEPDLVVLAGFMKLVSEDFLARLTTVNTHPALCPAFPGTSGPADALAYGVKVTGASLFVVDGGIDTGPIVAQTVVPVKDDDDVESLHERIKVAEREMLVDAVGRIARGGMVVEGRKVRIGPAAP